MKPEITIYNYKSHKKVDIRQRNKMMVEKGNFSGATLKQSKNGENGYNTQIGIIDVY